MGNTRRNVNVDQETVEQNTARSEKAYWKREAAARAKETKRIQAEMDQMFEEARKAEETDDVPDMEEFSLEEAIARKSAARTRRKRASKAKREIAKKASAAAARIETDAKKAVAAGRGVPEKSKNKKGYNSLLKRGAKFAGK